MQHSNRIGKNMLYLGVILFSVGFFWGTGKRWELWPVMLVAGGVLLAVGGYFSRITGVVLIGAGITAAVVCVIVLLSTYDESDRQMHKKALPWLGLLFVGCPILVFVGMRLRKTTDEEDADEAAEEAGRAAEASAADAQQRASQLACSICGRECVAFGTHGLLTSFSKALAKYCPLCRIWVCGHCGSVCPRCKSGLMGTR